MHLVQMIKRRIRAERPVSSFSGLHHGIASVVKTDDPADGQLPMPGAGQHTIEVGGRRYEFRSGRPGGPVDHNGVPAAGSIDHVRLLANSLLGRLDAVEGVGLRVWNREDCSPHGRIWIRYHGRESALPTIALHGEGQRGLCKMRDELERCRRCDGSKVVRRQAARCRRSTARKLLPGAWIRV